jgi:predicted AAA+ superfamily ATPase
MKRVVEQDLLAWKASTRRKPLILRGARQVGKTWLVDHFLSRHFDSTVKIDLEKRRDLHRIFDGNLDPKQILNILELSVGRILSEKTLLFFDEIQSCPRAIMALRYFYEEMPELHVIAAGSLLEFAFGEISVPVGRVQYLPVYPMTFFEYLLALGKEPMAECVEADPAAIPAAAHEQILTELRNYFFVGGMPECVAVWVDTSSMTEAGQVQSEIISSLRDDFSKYTPQTDPACLDAVLLSVAKRVGEQIKYTRLNEQHSGPTNRKAFDLLVKAKIVHKISACNPSGLPLGATANPKRFKAALVDIGLMQRLCQIPLAPEMLKENLLAIYRGKLAEQFVAQELVAAGGGELFYWAREAHGSSAEIDFLAVRGGKIYPVEVKSGAAGTLRSLHLILNTYPNCPEGIILSTRPYSRLPEQKLSFLPIYHAAGLSRNSP